MPKPENRWELYYFLGHVLFKLNISDLAEKHILLAYHLRNKFGWKIPTELQQIIDLLSINIDEDININDHFKQLKDYWRNYKYSKLPKLQGKIKTILPNNKSGFISANNGKDYYFKVQSINGNIKKISIDIAVEFYVSKSFDKSKNKESEQAINIDLIN